jgi:WhiB family redox-sensing transcriptional regulator
VSDLGWMDDASCLEVAPDLFFPDHRETTKAREAIKICDSCLVKNECLDYALSNRFDEGIFGGLTPNGRRKLIRQARRRKEL